MFRGAYLVSYEVPHILQLERIAQSVSQHGYMSQNASLYYGTLVVTCEMPMRDAEFQCQMLMLMPNANAKC